MSTDLESADSEQTTPETHFDRSRIPQEKLLAAQRAVLEFVVAALHRARTHPQGRAVWISSPVEMLTVGTGSRVTQHCRIGLRDFVPVGG